MVISSEEKFAPICNIVYATDLENITAATVKKINDLTQLFQAELHIVHVNINDKDHYEKAKQLNEQFHQPKYHEIKDENVAHGIKTYIEQNQADLIIVVHHKHSFWERLLSKTHSETVLMNIATPVLFLPE